MRVTISDIAKIANVTPSTVSRVIDNNPHISAETSERVRRVMRELDYHPNIIARSLVRRSTNILGVLLPGTGEHVFQHPFFSELLKGIVTQAKGRGYDILLSTGGGAEIEEQAVRNLIGGGVTEGVILTVSRTGQTCVELAMKKKFPLVLVGRPEQPWVDRVNWVDSDNTDAGYRLTRHFLLKGRRRIAFIGLADGVVVTEDRYEGYRHALSEAGIEPDPRLVVRGQFMGDDENAIIEELLSRGVDFDGIIAADDSQAFSAIQFLSRRGTAVPRDVSVAGFNNVPLSEHYNPPLTSVDVGACALGQGAFDLLYRQIAEKQEKPSRLIVPTKLIARLSV